MTIRFKIGEKRKYRKTRSVSSGKSKSRPRTTRSSVTRRKLVLKPRPRTSRPSVTRRKLALKPKPRTSRPSVTRRKLALKPKPRTTRPSSAMKKLDLKPRPRTARPSATRRKSVLKPRPRTTRAASITSENRKPQARRVFTRTKKNAAAAHSSRTPTGAGDMARKKSKRKTPPPKDTARVKARTTLELTRDKILTRSMVKGRRLRICRVNIEELERRLKVKSKKPALPVKVKKKSSMRWTKPLRKCSSTRFPLVTRHQSLSEGFDRRNLEQSRQFVDSGLETYLRDVLPFLRSRSREQQQRSGFSFSEGHLPKETVGRSRNRSRSQHRYSPPKTSFAGENLTHHFMRYDDNQDDCGDTRLDVYQLAQQPIMSEERRQVLLDRMVNTLQRPPGSPSPQRRLVAADESNGVGRRQLSPWTERASTCDAIEDVQDEGMTCEGFPDCERQGAMLPTSYGSVPDIYWRNPGRIGSDDWDSESDETSFEQTEAEDCTDVEGSQNWTFPRKTFAKSLEDFIPDGDQFMTLDIGETEMPRLHSYTGNQLEEDIGNYEGSLLDCAHFNNESDDSKPCGGAAKGVIGLYQRHSGEDSPTILASPKTRASPARHRGPIRSIGFKIQSCNDSINRLSIRSPSTIAIRNRQMIPKLPEEEDHHGVGLAYLSDPSSGGCRHCCTSKQQNHGGHDHGVSCTWNHVRPIPVLQEELPECDRRAEPVYDDRFDHEGWEDDSTTTTVSRGHFYSGFTEVISNAAVRLKEYASKSLLSLDELLKDDDYDYVRRIPAVTDDDRIWPRGSPCRDVCGHSEVRPGAKRPQRQETASRGGVGFRASCTTQKWGHIETKTVRGRGPLKRPARKTYKCEDNAIGSRCGSSSAKALGVAEISTQAVQVTGARRKSGGCCIQ